MGCKRVVKRIYHRVSLANSPMVSDMIITKTAQTKIDVRTIFLLFSLNFVNETGLTEHFATSTMIL